MINLVKVLGPVLQMAEGWTIELDENIHGTLDKRPDPTWPKTWFVPRTNGNGHFREVYPVMSAWGANHGARSFGHSGADMITLASVLRIPVCMHSVPDEKIFKPAVWNAFGGEQFSADVMACRTYGLLYG
jgi:L-fucose isomerase